jgi:ATP-dependent exoDNAse (exonuclease V) beta subunit
MNAPRYPRVIKSAEADAPQIVFDRTDVLDLEETLKQSERQEMERLLYVALTRAKHTLVLAFDREFFLNAKGQPSSDSQTRWLRAEAGENNYEAVGALPTEACGCAETTAQQEKTPRENNAENFGELETGWVDKGRQSAASFVRTVSPSKISPGKEVAPATDADVWVEIEPELRPPRIDNPATRYGVWWHEFMQRISWEKAPESWDKTFAKNHLNSPDMARSAREWRLLRDGKISDLLPGSSNHTSVIRVEMPFFWRMDERRCLEGIIDLAVFNRPAQEWLILDWKTNRVTADKMETLRAQYLPQLAAYWQVISEMAGGKGAAAIYSTATGQLVRYEADELRGEWNRLEQMPPAGLTAELSVAPL